jgi:hypothetical protein
VKFVVNQLTLLLDVVDAGDLFAWGVKQPCLKVKQTSLCVKNAFS